MRSRELYTAAWRLHRSIHAPSGDEARERAGTSLLGICPVLSLRALHWRGNLGEARQVSPELALIIAILVGAVVVALITLSYLDRRG